MHRPTMAATVIPRPPWCPTPDVEDTTISRNATKQVYVVKTRKTIHITINLTIVCTPINDDDAVAGDDARNRL